MLMFITSLNTYPESSSPISGETNYGFRMPDLRSNRRCQTSTSVSCHTAPQDSSRCQARMWTLPTVGMRNGGQLAHNQEIFRADGLLRERNSHKDKGWRVDRGPCMEKAPDGRNLISVDGYNQWVENNVLAPSLSARPQSKSPLPIKERDAGRRSNLTPPPLT